MLKYASWSMHQQTQNIRSICLQLMVFLFFAKAVDVFRVEMAARHLWLNLRYSLIEKYGCGNLLTQNLKRNQM